MSDYEPITRKPVTVYLNSEEMDMLDAIRKPGGVIWSRENMLLKCLKAEYERAMAEPKRARTVWGTDGTADGPVAHFTLGEDGDLRQNVPLDDNNITATSGWCPPSLEFFPFPPETVKANRVKAIKDMVDVIDAATSGPIRAVITGYVKGGGTMKTKVG